MTVVRLGRVALAGSMSEFIDDLLAETPQVRDPDRQGPLTERMLAPALPPLAALFRHVRAEVDPAQRLATPAGARAYPLGRCREITEAVLDRLAGLEPSELPDAPAEGLVALRAFLAAGGRMHRAWGDLRGRYFQNALIVGTLYVDVANDTVVVEKPPVEILPFAEAGFTPIADYAHFARIAAAYWGHRAVPNHVAPQLAPWCPLILVDSRGAVALGPTNRTLLGLTLAGEFAPSEAALAAPPPPPGLFHGLATALRDSPLVLSADPQAGRKAALAACRQHRAQRSFDKAEAFNQAMAAVGDANRRLAGVRAFPAAAPVNPAAAVA